MSEFYRIKKTTMSGIADAIRLKRDIAAGIDPEDMELQIGLIEGGGGLTPFYTEEFFVDEDISAKKIYFKEFPNAAAALTAQFPNALSINSSFTDSTVRLPLLLFKFEALNTPETPSSLRTQFRFSHFKWRTGGWLSLTNGRESYGTTFGTTSGTYTPQNLGNYGFYFEYLGNAFNLSVDADGSVGDYVTTIYADDAEKVKLTLRQYDGYQVVVDEETGEEHKTANKLYKREVYTLGYNPVDPDALFAIHRV